MPLDAQFHEEVYSGSVELPPLPATDNGPGAVARLLEANRRLRQQRWPSPYDRTRHEMILGDARDLPFVPDESVHLIVTSPPYFNLKAYASDAGGAQLGRIEDYEAFLDELDKVWRECERALVPGGAGLLCDRGYSDPTPRGWAASCLAAAVGHPGSQPQSRPGQSDSNPLVQDRQPHKRSGRRLKWLLRQTVSTWRDHQKRS